MRQFFFILLIVACISSCKKEAVQLSTSANDIFWLSNAGADMPIWVKGNTASKIMILYLHGGPGDGAYRYSGFETDQLWKNYAVAYWAQRDAGASAGNNNYQNLNLPQMIEDLEKVVALLKYRYGNDVEIFLMAHSFGALLGSGYLVKDENQKNIHGWIEVDGAHDYPESNRLENKMLIDTGSSEIAKGHYQSQWSEIVGYCYNHPPNVSLDVSLETDEYASEAEDYVAINHTSTPIGFFSPSSPISLAVNELYMETTDTGRDFLESLEPMSYTDQLYKINIPSLLIWGQYDFLVPQGCGVDALSKLGSRYKKMVMMPHSGHTPMNGDTDLFAQTVSSFIEAVR